MKTFLLVANVAVCLLFSILVMSQNKGEGFSATFGSTKVFRAQKRGAEKFISNLTLALAVLFLLISVAFLFA